MHVAGKEKHSTHARPHTHKKNHTEPKNEYEMELNFVAILFHKAYLTSVLFWIATSLSWVTFR